MEIKPKFQVGQQVWKFYCNYGPNGEYAAIPCTVIGIVVWIGAAGVERISYNVGPDGSWHEHMLHATEADAFAGHAADVQERYDREMKLINTSPRNQT